MKFQSTNTQDIAATQTPTKTIRVYLDADVLAWLKRDGRGYQVRANRMLRKLMLNDMKSEQVIPRGTKSSRRP